MRTNTATRLVLSLAIASALSFSLTACSGGGGGGNVKPTPPVSTGGSGGTGGGTGGGSGGGGTTPPTYTYPQYNHLVPTGAVAAQQAGFTGKGVTVGVLDSGVDESLAPLASNVVSFKSYLPGGSQTPNDTDGHGSTIEQVLAGTATGGYVGGVAPGASLAVAQTCDTSGNCEPYAQAYTDLTNAGVKLFNQSWGTQLPNPTSFDIQGSVSLYQPMVDAGALFVFAAGNSGANNLNYEAGLPSEAPTLQKGWLSVVNVQLDSNGNPTTLDSTSAACGVSAMWCVAAPGTNQTLAVPGTEFTSGLADGTSGSAAIVSGVAALVWQAYPWMSGTDVQQTILTTATPLGGAAPNATYGWGLVNAGKAVFGPAQFAFGEFDANIQAYNSTFANAISGSGSLALTGTTGTLTLSGANTYTGGTTITAATLNVTGSVASDVTLSGGALTGTGTINGNVSNAAGTVISAGTSAGQQLSITGNYTAQSSSATAVSLGNPLKIGGTAALDGTLEILAPATTYTPSSTETLLTAGSLTGSFATQVYGTSVFYQVSNLTYGATALTANVTREAVQQSIPLTAATTNVAAGLDNALNKADQWSATSTGYAAHSQFLGSAAQLLTAHTQSEAIASVASLNGEIYGTSEAIEAQQSQVTEDAISAHQLSATAGAQAGVWVQALGSAGGLSQSSFASAKFEMGGALVGFDTPSDGNLAGGLAFGHTAINANLAGLAGHTNGQADTLALYGKATLSDGFYLAGRASWSSDRMRVYRTALLGDTAQFIAGNRTDDVYRGTAELGKDFATGQNTTITPYLSVTGLRLDTGGFTENGAGGFGLAVKSQNQTASFATLGARVGEGFSWAGGDSVLTGYFAWRRTLSGMNLGLTAVFEGAPGSNFDALGQGFARNTGEIGVNVSTHINDRWSWYLNGDAQAARNRSHDLTANAGVEYRF